MCIQCKLTLQVQSKHIKIIFLKIKKKKKKKKKTKKKKKPQTKLVNLKEKNGGKKASH